MIDIKYIRISKFCDLTDYSVSAVESKIKRGDWLEGKQYIKAPDGHILIDIEGYKQWAEMMAFGKRQKRAMKSPSHIEGKDAANESSSSPQPLIANG